jgi:hypothetical protein
VSLHHDAWSSGRTRTVSGFRSVAKRTLCGLLSAVQQVGSQVEGAVPTIWADAFVTRLRDHRFRGVVQTGHSYVADLRMLEGCLALPTNKNPCGHLSPQPGDSQKAGEHRCPLAQACQGQSLRRNRVFDVGPSMPCRSPDEPWPCLFAAR